MRLQDRLQSLLLRVCVRVGDSEALAGDLEAESARLKAVGRSELSIARWKWQ